MSDPMTAFKYKSARDNKSTSSYRGVAVVTGGRRGIGYAAARALAMEGFDVAVLDLVYDKTVKEKMEALSDIGGNYMFLQADISRIDHHAEVFDRIEEFLGSINCIVNNAGIQVSVRGDMLEVEPDDFDKVLGVNLRGTYFFTAEGSRRMLAAKNNNLLKSITTITSANAHLASPEKTPYCISKAALSMASKLFAVRLASSNISVYEIRPGLIRTNMTEEVRHHYSQEIKNGISINPRWGESEEVGAAVATLAVGGLPFSTGEIINIGGGLQISRL